MDKEDGSLISSIYLPDINGEDQIILKSKASLSSWHCKIALDYLKKPENFKFYQELLNLEKSGYTINFEYTAPENRIVLEYPQENLHVLNIRSRLDGAYLDLASLEFQKSYPECFKNRVQYYSEKLYQEAVLEARVSNLDLEKSSRDSESELNSSEIQKIYHQKLQNFIQTYSDQEKIEGYVIRLKSGLQLKLKTKWYFTHHKIFTRQASNEDIFRAACLGHTDDMKSLYFENVNFVRKIEVIENFVTEKLAEMGDRVEKFIRKEFENVVKNDRKRIYLAASREFGKSEKYVLNLIMKRFVMLVESDDMGKQHTNSSDLDLKQQFYDKGFKTYESEIKKLVDQAGSVVENINNFWIYWMNRKIIQNKAIFSEFYYWIKTMMNDFWVNRD